MKNSHNLEELLHNSQVLATLVVECPTSTKKVTKVMRNSFLPKDWEENENARKQMVAPILEWLRNKSLKNMTMLGKEKWISTYITLHKKIYEMENATRMERIEVACEVYKSKFFNEVEEEETIEEMAEEEDNEEEIESEEVEGDQDEEEPPLS